MTWHRIRMKRQALENQELVKQLAKQVLLQVINQEIQRAETNQENVNKC